MMNIESVYKLKGNYTKAFEQSNKCLEIQKKILGPESIEVAKTISNIGIVYRNKGDYPKALENYNKCL